MRSVIPQPKKDEVSNQVSNIQSVGLEQALKELLNGVESLDDKS